jgi:hypothetical protein
MTRLHDIYSFAKINQNSSFILFVLALFSFPPDKPMGRPEKPMGRTDEPMGSTDKLMGCIDKLMGNQPRRVIFFSSSGQAEHISASQEKSGKVQTCQRKLRIDR